MSALQIIEFLAVITATLYGVLLARRKELDFVGVFAVSFAISFGGGTLRDLCLDRHPLFWIANGHYPVVVFVVSLVGSVLPRMPRIVLRCLPLADALGLGLFSVVGTGFALQANVPLFTSTVLGVITGTFGGVIGDVVCNEVPSLFRSAPLYATCSFVGCWVYVGLRHWPLPADWAGSVAAAVVVALRLAALRWDIRFPNLSMPEA